jgi:hypothetical protein
VTLGVRFLTIEAVVDSRYNGSVSGLMGNFDGNSTNDFILPNGTFLNPQDVDTEREIYNNFGQFCKHLFIELLLRISIPSFISKCHEML